MTVIVKPIGRGNWETLTLVVTGSRAQPLVVTVGETFDLGGVTWRVIEVRP